MKKIYNFTNIASHYRKNLWQKLVTETNFEFHFFYGTNKKFEIKEIDSTSTVFKPYKNRFHQLKNSWLKSILIWQKGVVKACLKDSFHTAIFLGEVHILTTWLAIVICKFRNIKIVFWTHGLYGNESYLKKKLRVLFYKTADKVLVYGIRAKKMLINEGLSADKLAVIFNSLDYDKQLKIRTKLKVTTIYKNHFNNNFNTLIFIGRLTKIKKLELLLKAQSLLKKEGILINSVFVGEGYEFNNLVNLSKELGVYNNCWFYGSTYNEDEIAELLYNATLCVSPGNVGLTAIHSLSYGTPVCTHNNFCNQMPEVEAIIENKTGYFFIENDVVDLKNAIAKWLVEKKNREIVRKECYKMIDEFYNPYFQVNVINDIINN